MAGLTFFRLLSLLSFVYLATAKSTFRHFTNSTGNSTSSSDVVQFAINLTWEDYAATGGDTRKVIFTNGTIPGPPLRLKVGQSVEFMVYNNLPFGTSVHFHGIGQLNTPWSDGVAGLSQYPIPPGAPYLYKWTADEPGTYFYHAHDKGQMMDGLYGGIIIDADDQTPRPFSAISSDQNDIDQMTQAETTNQPIFISDWTQYTFSEFYSIEQAAGIDNSCADSIIVNGKGSVYCASRSDIDAWTPPPVQPLLQSVTPSQLTDKGCLPPNLPATQGNFSFNLAALPGPAYFDCTPTSGENTTINVDPADGWAALSFINPGGFSSLKFTIDNHKLWVYAVSGAYVTPQEVDQVVVNNGDRYSVMVKLDQPAAAYTINVANNGLNQLISGYASLVYAGSTGPPDDEVSLMNYAGLNTTTVTAFNDVLASPFNPIVPADSADVTFSFNIKKLNQAYLWTLSGIQGYNMSLDDQMPLLFSDPTTIPSSDLILKTTYGQWVDLIINVEGPLAQPHPLHKHANKAFVLGGGTGPFNYSSVEEATAAMPEGTFNLQNPPYRDSYTTTPAEGTSAWMVLRYKVENPGVWPFHCHMQTHYSGGMAVTIIDAPEKIPMIPPEYGQGNGCPQDSPDYQPITGTTNSVYGDIPSNATGNGTSNGTYIPCSPKPVSSILPYTGAANVASLSMLVAVTAIMVAVFGFDL